MGRFTIQMKPETRNLLEELKDVLIAIVLIIDFLFVLSVFFFYVPPYDLILVSGYDLFVCIILFLNLYYMYTHENVTLSDFIKSHILEILSVIPVNFLLIPSLVQSGQLTIITVIQLLQILKLSNTSLYRFTSLKGFVQHGLLQIISIILVFYVILTTIVLTQFDAAFPTAFESFWFLVETLTSVGYGDIIPETFPGKLVGVFSIVFGVFFISIFTAAMSGLYMERTEKFSRHQIMRQISKLEKRHRNVEDKISSLDDSIDELQVKIDNLNNLIQEDIDVMQEDIDVMQDDIDVVEEDIDVIDDDIDVVKDEVDIIEEEDKNNET